MEDDYFPGSISKLGSVLFWYLNAHTLAVIFKVHLVLMHLDHAAEQRKEEMNLLLVWYFWGLGAYELYGVSKILVKSLT